MKMKKKTTAGLLLTLALLFSLFSSTACGQFSAETLSGDQSQEGASKIVSMAVSYTHLDVYKRQIIDLEW